MSNISNQLFTVPNNDNLIQEAYQRIGVKSDVITELLIQSAQSSINCVITEWLNRGFNLWTLKSGFIYLKNNQATYAAPPGFMSVLAMTRRTSSRALVTNGVTSGIPFASSGVASNAFDNDPNTACTQIAPNGFIGYDFQPPVIPPTPPFSPVIINMVGIQSAVNATYSITVEASEDGITYKTVTTIPASSYVQDDVFWANIDSPLYTRYLRIKETGGATLNIAELYFNNSITDLLMTEVAQYQYMSYPNKYNYGGLTGFVNIPGQNVAQSGSAPVVYYVNRQINPTITVWPVPTNGIAGLNPPINPLFNCLFYTYKKSLQATGDLTNVTEIPLRFWDALCANLAVRLAEKMDEFNAERISYLKAEAERQYNLAAAEDRQNVPFRFNIDYNRFLR